MPDYIDNPDDAELPDALALSPVRRIKGRLSGLHPEAAPPRWRGPDSAPCTGCCVGCGVEVLHGQAATGEHLWLDLSRRTWIVVHQEGRALPSLSRSRSYVEHQCGEGGRME